MTKTDQPAAGPDPLFSTQLEAAADRPFIWAPEAKSLSTPRTWAAVGLACAIFSALLLIVTSIGFIYFEGKIDPETFEIAMDEATWSFGYSIVGLIAMIALPLYLLGLVLTAIFHSWFVFRATKNLALSKARKIDFSPSWAVWVHYIPFISLWMPVGKVSRIWAVSHAPLQANPSATNAIPLWWALFIVSNIFATVSNRIYSYAEAEADLPTMIASYWIDIGVWTALAVSSVLLIRIHRQIATAQKQLAAASQSAPTST